MIEKISIIFDAYDIDGISDSLIELAEKQNEIIEALNKLNQDE